MKYLYAFLAALLFAVAPLKAQFYTVGNESPMKWSTIRTDHYRLVYPQGLDSLAKAYALSLEKYQKVVGNSCYTAPNELYKKPMPVVLHPYNAYANGSVAWAPRTMNLYTNPSAYGAEAWPWIDQLTLHENRHVAQLQFGKFPGTFRFFSTIFGQICTGALSGIYPGPALLEGDAVAAETALSSYGRGRNSDFLRYYRAAFDEGQYRNYWKWRWGSQKYYTPDHYKVGYMLVAGMRATYNEPDFTGLYYKRLDQRAWRFFNLQKTVKQVSGKKFKEAFSEIEEHFHSEWRTADSLRAAKAPFVEGTPVTSPDRLFDSYSNLVFRGNDLMALRAGLQRITELVSISPEGKSTHSRVFTRMGTKLETDENGTLWWTEYTPSKHWEMVSSSRLYSMDGRGKITPVVKGRRLYNPAAGKDGQIAVAEYFPEGTTALEVFSGSELVDSLPAPSGLQIVEPVWTPRGWYASAVNDKGYGLYRASDWTAVAGPAFAGLENPFWHEGLLWFCGESSGEIELYSLDLESGRLLQRTSTKRGVKECVFSPDGSELYYTSITADGNGIYKIPTSSLIALEAGFLPTSNPTANTLTAGERKLPGELDAEVSEPSRYRKALHALRIHSWAPVYLEYGGLEDLSYERTTIPSSLLGFTLLSQNDLGTLTGTIGGTLLTAYTSDLEYRTQTELDDSIPVHPALHANLLYTGLPVKMEFRADINERESYLNDYTVTHRNDSTIIGYTRESSGKPLVQVSANFYIPFNISRGGWEKGIVPSYQITFSNDKMPDFEEHWGTYYATPHKSTFRGMASLRAYAVQSIPSSCIFPRWGFGINIGNVHSNNRELHLYQDNTMTCDNINYISAYAYLPGVMRTHGIRIGAQTQSSYRSHFYSRDITTATVEYALPFAPVDWSFLGPLTYIRNFELHGHGSFTHDALHSLMSGSTRTKVKAYAGVSILVRLGNLFWAPFNARIGYQYMCGLTPDSKSYGGFVITTDI